MFKDFLKVCVYQVIYLIVKCFPYKRQENTLLLIKMDELGDYILFRQLLLKIRHSEKYKNYKIILVATPICKQLFEFTDSGTVNEVIWVQKKKFLKNFRYRFQVLKQIRRTGSSDLVNFIYSGIFRLDGVIAAVTPARVKTCMQRDPAVYSAFENAIEPSNIYTHVLRVGGEDMFEVHRNFEFAAAFLNEEIGVPDIRLEATKTINHLDLPDHYFIVFPGSGITLKKWPTNYFVEVANHIARNTNLIPVVAGSEADRSDCNAFLSQYNSTVKDLTGKTSIPEFATVLRHAACIISVDTGVIHLAAAVGCPVFALFTGLHYGRFAPYPAEIATEFYPVYPDPVDQLIGAGKTKIDFPVRMDSIKTIQPEKMIELINKNLIFAKHTDPGKRLQSTITNPEKP